MQITPELVFLVMMILIISYVWMPPAWLLMRVITPKNLVEKYFKPPHFNGGELIMMRHFPGSLFRTMILMGASVWPKLAKKRELMSLEHDAPEWYKRCSKVFIIATFVHGFSFILLLIGLLLYSFIFDS